MAMTLGLRRLLAVVALGVAGGLVGMLGGCAGSSTHGDGTRHDRGGYVGFSGGLNAGGGQGGEWTH